MLTATVYATSLIALVVQDETACNYNADATDEDGSCSTLRTVTIATASQNDADGDGVCNEFDDCGLPRRFRLQLQQTLRTAMTKASTLRTVTTATAYCLNDADSDGVCDEFEVAGCTNDDCLQLQR